MKKRDARREIVNALKREFDATAAGWATKTPEGREVFERLASGKNLKQYPVPRSEEELKINLLLPFVQGFVPTLKGARHLNEAQLDTVLRQIDGLRFKLRPFIRDGLAKMEEVSPTKKRGPVPKLSESERLSACSTIDTLVRNGSTTKFAIETVAKDYRTTPRLMRKYWEKKGA